MAPSKTSDVSDGIPVLDRVEMATGITVPAHTRQAVKQVTDEVAKVTAAVKPVTDAVSSSA